jgi:hypothetical protein
MNRRRTKSKMGEDYILKGSFDEEHQMRRE